MDKIGKLISYKVSDNCRRQSRIFKNTTKCWEYEKTTKLFKTNSKNIKPGPK